MPSQPSGMVLVHMVVLWAGFRGAWPDSARPYGFEARNLSSEAYSRKKPLASAMAATAARTFASSRLGADGL